MLIVIVYTFTGCAIWSGNIDALLSPPKLSNQEEAIYQALTSSLDGKISLKYPKTGEYLSAFIVANLDDEPSDEAMVFYEKTGFTADETSLRINILDQKDGRWTSVFDRVADGSEVETVYISKLGMSDIISIIVGYSMLQGEKQFDIYTYDSINYTLVETLTDNYSLINVEDVDNDGYNELFTVTGNTASSYAEAKLLKLDENGQYIRTRVAMDSNTTDYIQCLYGNSDEVTSKVIFVDSLIATGMIETEILQVHDNDQILENTSVLDTMSVSDTIRPSGYTSCDIDGDGSIEVPVVTTFTGYESLSDTEQLKMTNWLTYQNQELMVKYSGYYSINDGYFFALPERWKGHVTVKLDTTKNDVVFYEYDGDVSSSTTELLRLTVTDENDYTILKKQGYQLMRSNNSNYYLAKVSKNTNSNLEVSIAEVLFNLKFKV